MLKIKNLEAGYGKLRVLKRISMHIDTGEIVTIIGANGAGKTTLLYTIAGMIKATAGEISLYNQNIIRTNPESIVAAGCSLVPEGRQMFSTLSVKENLVLGGYVQRKQKVDQKEELQKIYDIFPVLKEREDQLAGTLSGGEQQMLAMGRALMAHPKLIMMDEPSTGLAPLIVKDIFAIINRLRDAGNTVLLVEQNAKAALAIADRGYVLETGKIILQGPAEDLLNNQDVQRAYLGRDVSTEGAQCELD
ncbi:MAG: ABC transporter ATP-binding protein [Desulfobulbaceae bacterium]|uniref:ABC transporter ATP-binding protein n=1 Tax=Candidatus Desulfobia pelagia TaxID=2841692 RepID=A0A8J6NDL7_9BACT|nr:ABC transporter ATP-binding protein [Candidatus Desulfobia pelagia]